MLRINTLDGYGYGGVIPEIVVKAGEKIAATVEVVTPIFITMQHAFLPVGTKIRESFSPFSLKKIGTNVVVNILQHAPRVPRKMSHMVTVILHLSPKKVFSNAVNNKKEIAKEVAKETMSVLILSSVINIELDKDRLVINDVITHTFISAVLARSMERLVDYGLEYCQQPTLKETMGNFFYSCFMAVPRKQVILIGTIILSSSFTGLSKQNSCVMYYVPSLVMYQNNAATMMSTLGEAATTFIHITAFMEYRMQGILVTGIAIGLTKGMAKANQELYEAKKSELFLEAFIANIAKTVVTYTGNFIPRNLLR